MAWTEKLGLVRAARKVGRNHLAATDDGHTNIAPTRDPKIGFRTLPVRLYFFKDGEERAGRTKLPEIAPARSNQQQRQQMLEKLGR